MAGKKLLVSSELKRLGMSQSALSLKSGICYGVVTGIVRGDRKPYPKAANAIAEAIGWTGSVDCLFEEVED